MPTHDLQVVLVGSTDRAEFRDARQTLDALGRVLAFPSVQSAAAAIEAGGAAPDVLVIAQAYPGQFPRSTIEQLRHLAPLARVIALLGTWCEGETRTGRPWPAVIRLYWHQGPARCRQELLRLVEGRGSSWGLPLTATDEERLLAAAERRPPPRRGLIAIFTPRADMEAFLAAACRSCGYATVWLPPGQSVGVRGATAAIYDGCELRAVELDDLRRLAANLAPTPILAILHFPRPDDYRLALAAGAAALLAKPLHVDDLLEQLDEIQQDEAAVHGPAPK
ncbi:MAG: hypothetical protein ABSF26_29550 [Thermoguttaceae bacterium]|jgi:DNA-binding NarL/FixJ family response regulator